MKKRAARGKAPSVGLPNNRSKARFLSYDVDDVSGAVAAPLPDKLLPQLATLSKELPAAGDWVYEIKLDGYRILTRLDAGKAHLFTRNGNDWTQRMAPLAQDLGALGVRSAWLDGG